MTSTDLIRKNINLLFENEPIKAGIVSCYFNSNYRDFLKLLDYLNKEMGISSEYLGCTFPSVFDEDEKDEDYYFSEGVYFFLGDIEETILSYKEFVDVVKTVCTVYIDEFPENADEVNGILDEIVKRYNC